MSEHDQIHARLINKPKGPFDWLIELLKVIEPSWLWFAAALFAIAIYSKGFWGVYGSLFPFLTFIISTSVSVWIFRLFKYCIVSKFFGNTTLLGMNWKGALIDVSLILIGLIGWIYLHAALGQFSLYVLKKYSGQPEYVIYPCGDKYESLTEEQCSEIRRFYLFSPCSRGD